MKPFKKTAKIPAFNKSLKDIKGEEWKDIPNFDGDFLISNYGRVKAMPRLIQRGNTSTFTWSKTKILTQWVSKNNNQHIGDFTFCATVTIIRNKKRMNFSVRRLVYESFIQEQINKDRTRMFIYNKDGNGLNNYYKNLGIATKTFLRKKVFAEKRGIAVALHADQEERKRHIHKLNKGKRKAVIQYSLEGKELARFESITLASNSTGINISGISACAGFNFKQAGGFIWRYDESS